MEKKPEVSTVVPTARMPAGRCILEGISHPAIGSVLKIAARQGIQNEQGQLSHRRCAGIGSALPASVCPPRRSRAGGRRGRPWSAVRLTRLRLDSVNMPDWPRQSVIAVMSRSTRDSRRTAGSSPRQIPTPRPESQPFGASTVPSREFSRCTSERVCSRLDPHVLHPGYAFRYRPSNFFQRHPRYFIPPTGPSSSPCVLRVDRIALLKMTVSRGSMQLPRSGNASTRGVSRRRVSFHAIVRLSHRPGRGGSVGPRIHPPVAAMQ